ncbi:MAG: hypothetical protein WEB60_02555 [Terrimicrobiaceae bacterium]
MKDTEKSNAEDAQRLIDSALGYLSLGLLDLAEEEVARAVAHCGESQGTLELKRKIASARGDYVSLGRMVMAHIDTSKDPASDLYQISIASDPQWVYSRCLAFEEDCRKDYLYWFNRACFACVLGKMHDALSSLLRGFCQSSLKHADAFVDHDLKSLWNWILEVPLDDELAEMIAHPAWNRAIQTQASSDGEIGVSPAMKPCIPEQFHPFLVPSNSMLRASPKIPASIYREYLEWQQVTALLRVDALKDAISRARLYLTNRQRRFAILKIRRGNLTAARYHIIHFLMFRSQEFPRLLFLRDLGMGYLLDDIQPARHEDPSFLGKMQSIAPFSSPSCRFDAIAEEIGEVGQATAFFQMRLAGHEIETGREPEAIRRLLSVIPRWPHDATPYSRLVDAYIRLERWEEARLCFRAAPSHYRQFHRCREQWLQIKEESTELVGAEQPVEQFVGQRDLGGLLVNNL